VYSEPDTRSKVLIQNIKAFEPLYVFERKNVDLSEGWYQVGKKVNKPLGWMQAKDILEWKHALVVSFTPDQQRHQVLMFKTKDALKQLLEAPDRQERVQAIYAGLKTIPPKVSEAVISVEPTRFVDIEKVFYLLPVLDFEQVDLFTRILQIASAVPGSRAEKNFPDIVENPVFMAQAMLGSQLIDNQIAQLAATLASSKEAMPPRDITAWVLERDLINPELRALEVRVLLTRTDMNNLIQALDSLLHQIKQSIVTPMEFFIGLQAVVTMALQDQEITLKAAERLTDAGLLQAWIESLPYKSEILEMSEEMFEELPADERAHLEENVASKLELYRKINENSDLWVVLDASDDHVYPLPLSALP
jgi:hypothetical protein